MLNVLATFIFLLSTNTCWCEYSVLDDTELVLAFMVNRHGDRTPVETTISFSTNPTTVRSLSSKYGYGQLTDVGLRRSYELGKSIRRRYGSYLSPQYNKSEIYIRSTDSTRTKMTVLTAMSAVYPAGKDNWSTDINWTPVPYTTVPAINDFNLANLNCPTFISAYYKAFETPVPEMVAKYSDLLNRYAVITGRNITQTPTMAYAIYDVYASQISLGVPLGEELEAILPEIAELASESMEVIYGNDSNINLQAGVLLQEFFNVADKLLSGKDEPRIRVYSAHDATVFPFTAVTRIQPKQGVPKYAAMYSLELRKVLATGEYVVVPVYFKEPGVDEVYLQMEGCEGFCGFESFRNLTTDYVLNESEWRSLCNFSEDYAFDTSSID